MDSGHMMGNMCKQYLYLGWWREGTVVAVVCAYLLEACARLWTPR